MNNGWIRTGAIAAFLGVAFGAFGAHMLDGKISAHEMEVYHTGVLYHLIHAAGLLLVAALGDKLGSPKLAHWSARLLLAGIVLFSGSLYALALTGIKPLGAVTPLGGLAFLGGWLCLALAAGTSEK